MPRDGQVRQDRPRDADLIRHHRTCRRKMAEPSLVRRVTTARVFHESVEELLPFSSFVKLLTTTSVQYESMDPEGPILRLSVLTKKGLPETVKA